MPWDGNIDKARESRKDSTKECSDGNREYSNGTYGQSDFTVRERKDGNYDVYVKSNSSKSHSHDVVDTDGNIIARYHDSLLNLLSDLTIEELETFIFNDNEDFRKNVQKVLKR